MKKPKKSEEIQRIANDLGRTAELVRMIKATAYAADSFANPDLYVGAIEISAEAICERILESREAVRQLGL